MIIQLICNRVILLEFDGLEEMDRGRFYPRDGRPVHVMFFGGRFQLSVIVDCRKLIESSRLPSL